MGGGRIARSSRSARPIVTERSRHDPLLTVTVDRDSVAAGDDTVSHAVTIAVASGLPVTRLLAEALRACPLAGIQGGKATWIVDVGAAGAGSIGVVAEQWDAPRLLVPDTVTVATVFAAPAPEATVFTAPAPEATVYAAPAPVLFFRYWCQADPDAVFAALRAGTALPSRYS